MRRLYSFVFGIIAVTFVLFGVSVYMQRRQVLLASLINWSFITGVITLTLI